MTNYPSRPDLVTPTLIEQALSVHTLLIGREKYRALLNAKTDEQAVEGALVYDDFVAAKMLQAKALELGRQYPELANAQLAPICDIVEVHLRNDGKGWDERRPQYIAQLAVDKAEWENVRRAHQDAMEEAGVVHAPVRLN